jgi:hypothetical protein
MNGVGGVLRSVVSRVVGSTRRATDVAAAAVRSEFPDTETLSKFSPRRLPTGPMGGNGLDSSVSPSGDVDAPEGAQGGGAAAAAAAELSTVSYPTAAAAEAPGMGAAAEATGSPTSAVCDTTDQILSQTLTTESINQQAMAMCHELLGPKSTPESLKLLVHTLRHAVCTEADARDYEKGLHSLRSLLHDDPLLDFSLPTHPSTGNKVDYSKVKKFLRNAMVSEVDRQEKMFPDGRGPDTGGGVHTQSFGQVVYTNGSFDSFSIDKGHTPSQEQDKFHLKHRQDNEVHVANLGHVKDAAGNVLLVRSARSTSPAKVKEVQLHGALAMGEAALAALPKDGAGRPIFKMEITSFMDDSTLKNVGEMFAERSELNFLGDIQRSISELYPEKTPTMVVHLDFGLGGASMEVVLARPTLVQVPLSQLGALNAADSRIQNQSVYRDHAIALGNQFAKAESQDLKSVGKALLAFETSTKTGAAVFESKFLSKANLTRLNDERTLTDSQFKAINALKLTLTGSTLRGNQLNSSKDSAFQLVYDSALKRELNIQSAIQCKSGQDRTGTGVALEVALQRLESKGRPFDPETATTDERNNFKLEFTKAVDQFCADTNTLCRDNEALKAENHPFFNEHYVTDRSARLVFGLSETSPVNIKTAYGGGGGGADSTVAETFGF